MRRRYIECASAHGKESSMPQRREAAIVGLYEYPLRVNPHVSAMQIKAECAAQALADAGLTWKDVDAVYDTGGDQGNGGVGRSENSWVISQGVVRTLFG